jgi:O-antigen ligase
VGMLATLVLVALALSTWIGAETAIQRFSLLQASDVSLSRRISMARGAFHVFLDHPITGTGLGTLVDVYPRYETIYDGKLVDHAHNDYVELLADAGLLGGISGVSFLVLLYQRSRRNLTTRQSRFSRGLHAGGIVAVSGLLFHSFFDFNLHVPSNALLFLLQAYLASSDPLPFEGPSSGYRESARVRSLGRMAETHVP